MPFVSLRYPEGSGSFVGVVVRLEGGSPLPPPRRSRTTALQIPFSEQYLIPYEAGEKAKTVLAPKHIRIRFVKDLMTRNDMCVETSMLRFVT